MSALPTPLGMDETPITRPVSLSPSAPMAIDGATPERVPGGLPPVPSTHRGDFFQPTPTARPANLLSIEEYKSHFFANFVDIMLSCAPVSIMAFTG